MCGGLWCGGCVDGVIYICLIVSGFSVGAAVVVCGGGLLRRVVLCIVEVV